MKKNILNNQEKYYKHVKKQIEVRAGKGSKEVSKTCEKTCVFCVCGKSEE